MASSQRSGGSIWMSDNNGGFPTSWRKQGKSDRTRRSWTEAEEMCLMGSLKELVSLGWKSDNGFRNGYQQKLEDSLRLAFPRCDIKANPHISSKIHTWKKIYGALSLVLGRSGVGFNLNGDYNYEMLTNLFESCRICLPTGSNLVELSALWLLFVGSVAVARSAVAGAVSWVAGCSLPILKLEYAAILPHVKLQVHGTLLEEWSCLPKNPSLPAKRGFYNGGKIVSGLSSWKARKIIAPQGKILNGSPIRKTTMCYCLNALANVDAAAAATSEWVPFIDLVLLLATITRTYMSGVVPWEKSPFHTQTSVPPFDMVTENSSSSGSSVTNDEVWLQFAWDVVRNKQMDSLSALNNVVNPSENIGKLEQNPATQPSSLYAVSEGPRIRLLWRSFQLLKKEASIFPLCMAWLEEEIRLISRKPDKDLLYLAKSKLNGYDSIVLNIRKSGKEDLYAELIYALKFGSSRKGGYYNSTLFIEHVVAILEDLLITLADGIASMYLELISVDSSLSNEMNNLGFSFCTLSTRALQRLRNEVALHQWLHQNMAAVASMYEDRFDLCILESQLIESRGNETEKFGWTKELRALVGWRYYFSLFLELTDINMPIVKIVVAKVSDAISFFLVSLIGRSLGLIYSGIRNSLLLKFLLEICDWNLASVGSSDRVIRAGQQEWNIGP
ncbi:hypothetical protein SASPL_107277 [Salvia splendens]|uniref:Myb/SANT-like domain-containing protein n=1 Tax=Salvia splendens TaxID=180675 RepID=A0A8X8YEM0_SALSN|nr:hypothetical protein SASPL_107277 [Salvia splendens]